jgi:hypothetical protein
MTVPLISAPADILSLQVAPGGERRRGVHMRRCAFLCSVACCTRSSSVGSPRCTRRLSPLTAGRPGPVRPPACPGDARLRQPGACQRLKSMHAGSTPHARALAPDMAYEALRGNIACGRRTRHHVAWRRDRSAPGPARGPGILTSSIARRAPSGPAVASPIRTTLRQKPGKRGYTTAPDLARLGGGPSSVPTRNVTPRRRQIFGKSAAGGAAELWARRAASL